MLIGLDARAIYRESRRGTGKNLIDLYSHLATVRPRWRVVAYHRQPGPVQPLLPMSTTQPRLIEIVGDRFDAWQRWRLPLAAWRDQADILHCPANHCPAWMPVNTVVTIHDLIPLDFPLPHHAKQTARFEQSVRTACRQASQIICPSRYTRDRLIAQFGADPGRITINPWAPDSSVQPVPEKNWRPVLEKYNVDRPFVLHFGAAETRKNTQRVIEAWATCDRKARRNWQLLIIGLDEKTRQELAATVTQFKLKSSVRLHGFADEDDLPTLLSASGVLAYPSLSEGFGLPILDAWAAGTAVLTSDATSLPEVAGDAAVLVDPTDVCSIARGLYKLLRDARLRSDLVALGQLRLKQYSWQATAQRFAEVIEQAVESREPVRAAA